MAIKDQTKLREEMDILEDELASKHNDYEILGHEWPQLDMEYKMAKRAILITIAKSSVEETWAKTIIKSSTLTQEYIESDEGIAKKKFQLDTKKNEYYACREAIDIKKAMLNSHQSQLRLEYSAMGSLG